LDHENLKVKTLFGEEVYLTPRKKGRPPFEWTEENSNKVSMLLAMGWTNERIASVVIDPRTGKSISMPTLKRHFRAELSVRQAARDRLMATRLMQTFTEADKGNVGAQRLFDQLVAKNDMMLADARMRQGDHKANASETSAEKLGKKQIAQRQADELADGGGAWGDDLKPGACH
jgi:hypothetical protein